MGFVCPGQPTSQGTSSYVGAPSLPSSGREATARISTHSTRPLPAALAPQCAVEAPLSARRGRGVHPLPRPQAARQCPSAGVGRGLADSCATSSLIRQRRPRTAPRSRACALLPQSVSRDNVTWNPKPMTHVRIFLQMLRAFHASHGELVLPSLSRGAKLSDPTRQSVARSLRGPSPPPPRSLK